MELVTVEQIQAAHKLLAGVVRHTPMEHARNLPGNVYLKCENLQRTGSFKIRGAYTRLSGLSEQQRANGVVAASAGNHAQGVAYAATLLGIHATVFMPQRAPLPKLEATQSYGAQVHLTGSTVDDALAAAVEFGQRTGAVFIHPFDHPDIIAGQGTVGLEIIEQVPDVATVLVAMGGGGLVSGIATAIKATHPNVRVIGVQAEQAAAFPASLAEGHPVRLRTMQTMADGIAVGAPGPLSLAQAAATVDEVITVSEESLSHAVLQCLERRKLVVEPAGAAPVAALLQYPEAFRAPVVCVLSGGNVDPLLLLQIIQHGMTTAGRYLSLRLRLPDRPGSLAAFLTEIGEYGGNVLDVEHSRVSGRLAIGEVQVEVNLETRGQQHRAELLKALSRKGYPVDEE